MGDGGAGGVGGGALGSMGNGYRTIGNVNVGSAAEGGGYGLEILCPVHNVSRNCVHNGMCHQYRRDKADTTTCLCGPNLPGKVTMHFQAAKLLTQGCCCCVPRSRSTNYAGMSNSALPSGKPPSKGRTTSPAAAYHPPVVVNHPAALHAAQMHHIPPSGVYAQPPAVPTGHVPMQQHHLQYPPQPHAQHQPMPPQAAAAPSDAVPQPLAATGHTHAFAGSHPPGNMPPAPLWPQAGGTPPQFVNPQFAQQHFAQPQFVQQQLGAQPQFAQAQFAQPPPVAMAPVGGAAPAAARGRQGPSMLGTLVAFRMGQRAGRRQQQRRMGRRC